MTAGSSGQLRAGIVGARRVRQGLGPFVARDLTAAGVSVDLVLGTSEATAEEAAALLMTSGRAAEASAITGSVTRGRPVDQETLGARTLRSTTR